MRRSLIGLGVLVLACGGCGSPPRGVAHAQKLLAQGDYQAAERAADRGLEEDPDNRALWHVKIRAPMERGDSERGVDGYLKWHHLSHRYDDEALRQMATAVLHHGLSSARPEIRRAAVDAVARLGLERLYGTVAGLLDDRDPKVAAAAAVALLVRDPRALPVARRLAESPDPGARAAVVTGFARNLRRAGLVRPALEDRSPRVRRAAVTGLGRLGADRARLRVVARTDPDGTVRAAALSALRGHRSRADLELARAALADSYVGARLAAVALLAANRDSETLGRAAASADSYVALRAAVALGKAGGEPPTTALELALASRAWPVRVAGLNALVELVPAESALAMATPLIDDPRVEVGLAAARVLVRLGRTVSAASLCYRVLEGPREDMRLVAATQLREMDDPKGVIGLVALGRSKDPAIRTAVAHAYRQSENVTLPLVGMLADRDPQVRLAAAESMLGLL